MGTNFLLLYLLLLRHAPWIIAAATFAPPREDIGQESEEESIVLLPVAVSAAQPTADFHDRDDTRSMPAETSGFSSDFGER